ncbi:MAG: hypothetical protein V3T77_05430 [Planctomycetota bacterium]
MKSLSLFCGLILIVGILAYHQPEATRTTVDATPVLEAPLPRPATPIQEKRDRLIDSESVDLPAPVEDLPTALVGIAHAFASQDKNALEEWLEQRLANPDLIDELLQLLASRQLEDNPAAKRGALHAICAALQLYHHEDAAVHFPGLDPDLVLLHTLRMLPELPVEERSLLIEMLADLQVGGEHLINLSYLEEILSLRSAYPQDASLYSRLLANLAESLEGAEARKEFHSLFLNEQHDPTLLKMGLSGLLREDPKPFLAWAEKTYQQLSVTSELRGAISQAIASSAPVELAAQSLARIANSYQYSEFDTLGSRQGGVDAAYEEYLRLARSPAHALARRMLVTAMGAKAEPELFLDIARFDAAEQVRAQAYLCLTYHHPVELEVLDGVIQATEQSFDPQRGLGVQKAVWICSNIVRRSKAAVREQAVHFLKGVIEDASLSQRLRWEAAENLKKLVSVERLHGLEIAGVAVVGEEE